MRLYGDWTLQCFWKSGLDEEGWEEITDIKQLWFQMIEDLTDISFASHLCVSDSLSSSFSVCFKFFLILFRILSWGRTVISNAAAVDALHRGRRVSAASPVCRPRCWAALRWWCSWCCWIKCRSSSTANATMESWPHWLKDCRSASI